MIPKITYKNKDMLILNGLLHVQKSYSIHCWHYFIGGAKIVFVCLLLFFPFLSRFKVLETKPVVAKVYHSTSQV